MSLHSVLQFQKRVIYRCFAFVYCFNDSLIQTGIFGCVLMAVVVLDILCYKLQWDHEYVARVTNVPESTRNKENAFSWLASALV